MASIVQYAPRFNEQVALFVKTLQEYINDYWVKAKKIGNPPKVTSEFGTKWVKIVTEITFDQRSVHCFIEPSGNIFKAASWSSPAKHPRGSIFDENCGVGTVVDVYGARSLK